MMLSYEDALQQSREMCGAGQRITCFAPPGRLPPSIEQTGSGFFDPDDTGKDLRAFDLCRILCDGEETFRMDGRRGG